MKKLLSLLCALTMLVALVPAACLPTAAADTRAKKPLYQEILERDGFIEGVWYPWFTHTYLGCGFTANEVAAQWITNGWYDFNKVGIDTYGADNIYAEIYNLKALGYNMLAIAGSPYGEGVVYDNNGDVLGIKDEYLTNVARFLEICREIDMPVMWNICFHTSSAADYYGPDVWNILCRMYYDPTVADHYAQRFVKPLCQLLDEYDDVVALIALTDEVENEIHDADEPNNWGYATKAFGTTEENILYFVNAMNEVVKKEVPQIARTIAANSDDLGLYSEVDVDTMGRNRYSDEGTVPGIDRMYPTAPMLLTEWNLHEASGMSESDYSKIQIKFRDEMKRVGYQGGFQWCWQPNAKGGAMDLLMKNGSVTDFRQSIYDRYYYTMDALAKYQGKQVVLDTPSLFYYKGNGLLEWVPSRQATSVTIEKSSNGGKTWQMVKANIDPDSLLKNGKCVYQATNVIATDYYRVTVTDGKGHTASAVTNRPGAATEHIGTSKNTSVKAVPRPTVQKADVPFSSTSALSLTSFGSTANRTGDTSNLIQNGGCEQLNSGQWNNSDFLGSAVKVVYDTTTPDGNKSLHFDTRSQTTGRWYTFKVAVEKNTDYTLSAWVKGAFIADDNRFYASMGVLNPATKTFATYSSYNNKRSRQDRQIFPPAWDNQWHLRSVTFNSGNLTEVVIGFYGAQSEMWVDGMQLYKSGNGTPYYSDNARGVVTFSYGYQYMRCDPAKSLTHNVRMDDAKSTYWQQGGGWDTGFMSMVNTSEVYGQAMKYTASANPAGVSYIKWIPVKKDTEYVVTFDYKVIKEGDGRIRLGVKQAAGIVSVVTLDFRGTMFHEDENGWCTFSTKLDTSAFDQLAFIVTDLGGEALIDNVRVFDPRDGSDISDLPGGNTSGTTAPVVRPTASSATSATATPTDSIPSASTSLPTDHVTETPTVVDIVTTTTTAMGEVSNPTTTIKPQTATVGGSASDTPTPWGVIALIAGAVVLVGVGILLGLWLRRKRKQPEV